MWRGRWACCRDAKEPLTASPPSDDATERSRRMASTTGAAAVCSDAVDEEATWCVFLENVGGGGEGMPESQFFAGRPGTAPDFAGYTIDRVEFQIDSVLIASPGSDQLHDGIWTDSYLAGRVVVWGHR